MRSNIFNLPNILTFWRIFSVPLVVFCFLFEETSGFDHFARWFALIIFIIASLTDYLDGYLARVLRQTSSLGRMLDPVADKLLVATCLLLLASDSYHTIKGWSLVAAVIILCREILVSGLREHLANLQAAVPVALLSKWKTGIQMLAIGFLLAGHELDKVFSYGTALGIFFLWVAALLTLYTGWDYFRAGMKHMFE